MVVRKRTIIFLALALLNAASNKSKKRNIDKKYGNNLELPSFKNALEIKSSMKGRIRFFSPIIKSNNALANHLLDQVKQINVIKLCTVNTLTGTILVEYDSDKMDPQTLEGAIIKLIGADKAIEGGRVSQVRKETGSIVSALNNGIYDFSGGILDLKSVVASAFLIAAVLDYRKYGMRTPDYLTLLWWSSSLL